MLFFNSGLLAQAGVSTPSRNCTGDAFLSDLGKLKPAGITPLCLGAKDPFTTNALFENILLGVVGEKGWQQISRDRFNWNGPQTKEALTQFGAIFDYADPEAAALSWDAATRKLADGGCAFEALNDSAFGELVTAGAVDGKDFSQVP